jgi:hypothetical protein
VSEDLQPESKRQYRRQRGEGHGITIPQLNQSATCSWQRRGETGEITFESVFWGLIELLEGLLSDVDPLHACSPSAEQSGPCPLLCLVPLVAVVGSGLRR